MRKVAIIIIALSVFGAQLNADRPPRLFSEITVNELWNYMTNYGSIGGENEFGWYGLSWPGDFPDNNFYLWNSYIWVGAIVGGDTFVTHEDYQFFEWGPSEGDPFLYIGPDKSDWDILASFDDYDDNFYNMDGRHLGVKVLARSLAWEHEPWNDMIAYEFAVSYDSSRCDIPGHGPMLEDMFFGIALDMDISGADNSNPHIDDMASFDGWVAGTWPGYPYDSVTLLPDSFIQVPDGFYDQYTIWGDSEYEFTVRPNDTLLVPRNTSYMWDGDDPSSVGIDDTGEFGKSAGFAGIRLIYAPMSAADSVWFDGQDTLRIPRPWAHQYWNWEEDPETDEEKYLYLAGAHPNSGGYRYRPDPEDVFDYRILISSGPFDIETGDTLKFVFGTFVGQGLNGGVDTVYDRGWQRGMRQTADYLLLAYYSGSTQSDPYHPSDPDEDVHWDLQFFGYEEATPHSSRSPVLRCTPSVVRNTAQIEFELPKQGQVELQLYDVTGRRVRELMNQRLEAGHHATAFDVNGLPSGSYFVVLRTKEANRTTRLLILK